MNLLWHVVKKDLAALRWWLLAWVAACLTHFVLRLIQLPGGNAALPARFTETSRPDFLAVVLLLILIIPQLIQLDPPGRGGAFWRTVPLSRRRLLLAKCVLIVAVFVIFPLLLEAVYFGAAGFGSVALTALGMWLLRMLPIVAIVAAVSALARDRRLAALLIGGLAILILESGLSGPSLANPSAIATSVLNAPQLWSGMMACWLAAVSLPLFGAQYLLAGRFVWILVFAMLLVTYPVRKWFAPLPALASSAAPGMTGPAPYPPPFPPLPRQALAEVKPVLKPMVLPAGAKVTIDPLPSYIAFIPTRDHGELFYAGIRVGVEGLPKGVMVSGAELIDCKLVLLSKTMEPASQAERETDYFPRHFAPPATSLRELEEIPPEARLCLPSEVFAASRDDLAREPAVITGKLRLKLTRLAPAGSFGLRPGVVWQRELHDLRIQSAHRGGAGYSKDGLVIEATLTTTTVGKPEAMNAKGDYPTSTRLFLRNDLVKVEQNVGTLSGKGPIIFLTGAVQAPQELTDMTRERGWVHPSLNFSYDQMGSSGQMRGLAFYRLISDFGDLEHWHLDLERADDLGEIEVSLRVGSLLPAPVPWSTKKSNEYRSNDAEEKEILPELRSHAFFDALSAIELRDRRNPGEVDDYLDRLIGLIAFAPSSLCNLYENDLSLKLSAVGSENFEALLRRGASLTAPESSREYNYQYSSQNSLEPRRTETGILTKVICDLARDSDKKLILKYLSPRLDLFPAAEEHGWQSDAIAVIAQRAMKEAIPDRWLDLLAKSGDPEAFPAILAQLSHGNCNPDLVEKISEESQLPSRDLTTAAWTGVQLKDTMGLGRQNPWWNFPRFESTRTPWLLRLFSRSCAVGVPSIPRDLLCILQMSAQDWSNQGNFVFFNYDEQREQMESTLLNVFSRYAECPVERNAAVPWLMKNAAKLQFNPQNHRYEAQ